MDEGEFYYPGFTAPYYTPVPDDVFDVIAPRLTEAELRVLLYIIRRTFGFKKGTDTISLKQMVEGIVTSDGKVLDHGTGVAKSTAVRAVKGLIEKGIVTARRNSSPEKGDEPTTYELRWRGERPVFYSETRGGSTIEHPRVSPRYPQETDLQETEGQETVFSNIRMAPSWVKSPEYDEARRTILEYVEDVAREFRDKASLKSSASRAANLHQRSGLGLDTFLEKLQQARAITKERSAHIRSQEPGSSSKHKMAYFFGCLENLLESAGPKPPDASPRGQDSLEALDR